MTRLNKESRKAIVKGLLKYRFREQANTLRDEHAKLAAQLYDMIYKASDLKLMAEAPQGAFDQQDHISATINDSWTRFYFNGAGLHRYYETNYAKFADEVSSVQKLIFAKHRTSAVRAFYNDDKFTRDYQKMDLLISQFNDAVVNAKAKAEATLNAFTLVKDLIKAWPEIEPFAKPYLKAPEPRQLPVIQTATLNETFKLPVPELENAQ